MFWLMCVSVSMKKVPKTQSHCQMCTLKRTNYLRKWKYSPSPISSLHNNTKYTVFDSWQYENQLHSVRSLKFYICSLKLHVWWLIYVKEPLWFFFHDFQSPTISAKTFAYNAIRKCMWISKWACCTSDFIEIS